MKRRDTLKTLLVGTVAGAAAASTIGCKTDATSTGNEVSKEVANQELYGRLPHELERDEKLRNEIFLNQHELATIAVLCDIILPASPTAGSATDAEVPAFIEFIVKDMPYHQLPMRGGLMWLDIESNRRFDKEFISASEAQQIEIVEDIAYPDTEGEKPAMAPGIKFFNLMRNLTLTGYYTTRMGIDDLGYVGNFPNTWDGVPDEVLKDHDVAYEPEWLAKCVDQSQREVIAEWDDEGNLLT
ncbi:MAG: gluconate 2-dehydrogenase subunit 3 family protein [Saprospiraceae bacterium]|nr:gluconate 2-dehydrogenase subunit 3 family protein [Saprospiraceae bacterium]